jgi:hypothetical protein
LLASLEEDLETFRSQESEPPPTVPETTVSSVPTPGRAVAPPAPPPPRVSLFGDSILLTLGLSMGFWNRGDSHLVLRGGVAELGCGIVRGGAYQEDQLVPVRSVCDDWPTSWPDQVRRRATQVAVVMSCQWELLGRRLPGRDDVLTIGDPTFDDRIRAEMLAATDALHGAGAALVEWVSCPHLSQKVGVKDLDDASLRSRDPARVERLNQLIREVAAARPDWVAIVDLGAWVDQRVDDKALRSDGSHFEHDRDTGVAQVFGTGILDGWTAWDAAHPH